MKHARDENVSWFIRKGQNENYVKFRPVCLWQGNERTDIQTAILHKKPVILSNKLSRSVATGATRRGHLLAFTKDGRPYQINFLSCGDVSFGWSRNHGATIVCGTRQAQDQVKRFVFLWFFIAPTLLPDTSRLFSSQWKANSHSAMLVKTCLNLKLIVLSTNNGK